MSFGRGADYLAMIFRFRNGIKDLEVMMQNLIVSAFETVMTVEQGVEVLDVFMHLSSREVHFFGFCLLTHIVLAVRSFSPVFAC